MLFGIIACVLAIVVPCAVGLVQFRNLQSRWLEVDSVLNSYSDQLLTLRGEIADLEKLCMTSSPAVLKATVDDLAASVDADRASVRRQLGKIWGTLGAEGINGRDDHPAPTLPKLPGWQ